jgi:hypothetical protein
MSNPTKATVIFKKKGSKTDRELSDYLESFSYIDVAEGGSDSISVDLNNLSKKFTTNWLPTKGSQFSAAIKMENWSKEGKTEKQPCGTFTLDDYTLSGRPLVATLDMVSAPANSAFTTKERTKTWKSITIQQIAKKIAARYKLKLVYEASQITIKTLEQSNKADSTFLNDLCNDYGIAMKIFANKLILYSESKYESKKIVSTIDEKDMKSWTFNTTLAGTYTGCKYSYTNPSTNKTVNVQVGKGSRWLTVSGEASSKADAQKKAYASVNNSNKSTTTIKFEIFPNSKLYATANIKITGLGKLNGKYFITKITHNITPSGYSMSVEARKIQQRLPNKK